MKKISALLLATALLVPFTGCGGSSEPVAPDSFTESPMSGENFDNLKGRAAAKAAQDAAKDKVGEAAEPMS